MIGGPSISSGLAELAKHGLVNFSFPKDAVEALNDLALGEKKPAGDASENPVIAKPAVGLKMMDFDGMNELFKKYDLHLPCILIHEKSELPRTLAKLGGRSYVVKVMSPDVIHKTDIGAIALNIMSLDEAEQAWDTTRANVERKIPNAVIQGTLVQPMFIGKEVIVGMKRDPLFGPTVLVGLGGIFTEALKDTALRIAPVFKEVAMEMIHELRGISILTGMRGEKPTDLDKLADIIVNVSRLAVENPHVKEIDLNPVIMIPNGADIADSRVMI
jgi:acyl-CoA synthetase (NDP forming)